MEDAAAWLHREGATLRKHLLDVTKDDVQAAELQTFVARRFLRMLESERVVTGEGGGASSAVEAPVEGDRSEAAKIGKDHTSEDVSREGDEMVPGAVGGGDPPPPPPDLEAGDASAAAEALVPLSRESDEAASENRPADVDQVPPAPKAAGWILQIIRSFPLVATLMDTFASTCR